MAVRLNNERNNELNSELNKEEESLFVLLRTAMGQKNPDKAADCSWEKLLDLARAHAVSAMLYDVLERQPHLPEFVKECVQKDAQSTVLSGYRLLFLTAYLTESLKKHGITAVTLKGAATAAFYPVPEYRKSGDIDLLIVRRADLRRAAACLQEEGFRLLPEQPALHHVQLENSEGISVELHHSLTEPFENQKVNAYLNRILPEYGRHIVENQTWGLRLLQPSDAYHAFYLLVHMLQHFLREGFGLKNLCDWTLFWNRDVPTAEKTRFQTLIRESGTAQFVQVVTAVCVKYLGLSGEKAAFLSYESAREEVVDACLRDVLEAGEFGRLETDRMVAMQGTGVLAYVQVFQHQMHLNYPKAGRVFVCWPVLWILTLIRFLYNNRRLQRAPVRRIMKKAGRRSQLVKQMRLFR